jgi:acyl-CoA thioesterase-1
VEEIYNIMFKIKLTSLFIIISICSCAPSINNLDSQGKNIICFGDSITKGEGAADDKAYPEVLRKLLGRSVINAGVSGDTTITALERLEEDVLDKSPFLVIVELGGNDFLQQRPKELTLKNLEEIIIRIQESGSAVALCDVSSGFILSDYRNDFERLAKKTGSIFIPCLLGGILNNPSMRVDNIHPNEEGYELIAQRVYKEVKRYFRF